MDEITNDIDYSALKGQELYNAVYDLMNLMIAGGKLSCWADLNLEVGKHRQRVYERYIPWLKKEHPGAVENAEQVFEYVKQTGLVRNKLPTMDMMLNTAMTPERIREMFRTELATQIKGNMATKVKLLLDSMENDLLIARQQTVQASMMAITGYLQSIKKRIEAGEPISSKEFRIAYEIYKTEVGEPTTIKETRTKNMQVTLQVPISKEDVTKILRGQVRQDLSIECADEFKDQLEKKFTTGEIINDEHGGHPGETGGDGAAAETEKVPDERAVQ